MLHVHFTEGDATRITLAASAEPLLDTLLAVEVLARYSGDERLAAWRRRTACSLPHRARSLVNLARVIRPVPDMLSMAGDFPSFPVIAGSTAQTHLRQALVDFHRVAVAPYWARIQAQLNAHRPAWINAMRTGGPDGLLNVLAPDAQLRSPDLDRQGTRPQKVRVPQHGLRVVPAFFLSGRPAVLLDSDGDQPARLAVRAPVDHTAVLPEPVC
jgi:hypothetical protein